jgi:hypothetical protein
MQNFGMTADEFINKILSQRDGGIERVIAFAGGHECDWLEFKDSLYPRDGKFPVDKKGRSANHADYQWNLAKAVISMANSWGGAILLGVQEEEGSRKPLAAGLYAKKKEHCDTWDDYCRFILEPALFSKKGWITGQSGSWKAAPIIPDTLVDRQKATFQGKTIGVLIVKPVATVDDLIYVEDMKHPRWCLLARQTGHVGICKNYCLPNEIESWKKGRDSTLKQYSEKFDRYYDEFQKEIAQYVSKEVPPFDLEDAIAHHRKRVVSKLQRFEEKFVELEAEEILPGEDKNQTDDPSAKNGSSRTSQPRIFVDDELDEMLSDTPESATESRTAPASGATTPRTGEVLELLKDIPRMVLLGDPGSGKTAVLLRRLLEMVKEYKPGKTYPVYIGLSKFRESDSLRSLICRETGFSKEHCDYLIRNDRIVLHLDALHECRIDFQERCTGGIAEFIQEHPGIGIVASMRKAAWKWQFDLPAFEIKPLDDNRQLRMLEAYLDSDVDPEEIRKQIHAVPQGGELASNPWVLRIFVELAEEANGPIRQAILCREYLKRWYVRETKIANRSGTTLPLNEARFLLIATRIAFAMRRNGSTWEAPVSWLERNLPRQWFGENDHLGRLAQAGFFDLDRESDTFAFRYKILAEYFVALRLLRDPKAIGKIPSEGIDHWAMPLVYACELEPSPPNQIWAFLATRFPLLAALLAPDELVGDIRIPPDASPRLAASMEAVGVQPTSAPLPAPQDAKTGADSFGTRPIQYAIGTNPRARKRFDAMQQAWKEA